MAVDDLPSSSAHSTAEAALMVSCIQTDGNRLNTMSTQHTRAAILDAIGTLHHNCLQDMRNA